MSITENKKDIDEYIEALKSKWFNNYDNLPKLQKKSAQKESGQKKSSY